MPNAWMIRAGENSRLIEKFAKGYVAVGWNKLGDTSELKDREAFKQAFIANHPHAKKGHIGNSVAMIYKFCRVIQVGDYAVTYDASERVYLVGTIESNYQYQPDVVGDYPQIRKVKWLGKVSRDDLSVSSRNSLGSTLTLFSVNDDVIEELLAVLKGEKQADEADDESEKEELTQAKEDMAERSKELIMDRVSDLDDRELEFLIAGLLRAMGFKSRVSPRGGDRGVDVFASPDGLGLMEPRIKVEVKHRGGKIGAPHIRSFIGALRPGDRGMYVSTGGFTQEAKYECERSNTPIAMLDLATIAEMITVHYENMDSDTRSMIPLAKIYWPA